MNDTLLLVFGVLSALFNLTGLVPYIRDILVNKTKPERATWWIWSSLSTVSLFAQIASGAKWSILMTAAQLIAVICVASLSVKYGYGKFHKKDYISLVILAFGLGLWSVTDNPLTALIIVVFLDIVALSLTLQKTWHAPYTETLSSWILASLSGLFGVFAIGHWTAGKAIYPLYITLGNSLLTATIIHRRKNTDYSTRK